MLIKRISKEVEFLKKKYNVLNYSETLKEIIIDIDYENIRFVINEHYPFKPPKMYVNNLEYYKLLFELQSSKADKLKELNEICLCCKSILCPNNWKPAYKIINIVEEYDSFKSMLNI